MLTVTVIDNIGNIKGTAVISEGELHRLLMRRDAKWVKDRWYVVMPLAAA
jgi:hypothetical protein